MTSAQNQLTAGQVLTDTITVSAADGSSQVLSVTITGTNDQPYTVNSDYVTTLEDAAAPVNGVTQGTLISSLYLASSFNDAEGTIAGVAFVGPRAIVSANPGLRAAWYSSDGGATWLSLDTAIATASTSNAFILGANARLYFQGPANDWGTFLSAPVRLWDGTDSATVGSYKNISSLTGANGAYSAADTTLSFVVIGVNDAPVNTVPAGPVITSPNTAQVITGLQVADLDVSSTVMTVKLAVASGTLTLLSGSGVTLAGNGTATVTLSGTQSNLNTLLATNNAVTYTPITGFLGSDTLTMTTTDNFVGDQWNTGPALSDVDTVAISVLQEQVTVAITGITTDSGTSNTDHITNDKTPTISGTSDKPNRPLTLTIAGVTFSVMTDGSGNWSVDTGALTPTSGTYDKTVGFADGVKAISVSLAGNMGGVATATSSVTIDTAAPTVLVTSVFGDAVGASGNGTFSGTERGFNLSDYTLSSTVTSLPVISGTTTAEDGQTVTVTLAGQTYTATASGGAWSVQVPSADAVLLNHGNTYAISASVSDKAGNAAVADTNNGVLVNIAPPDVPTVVSQSTLSTTPTLTGLAKKLDGSNSISLATGDVLTVVIKDAAGTATLGTYTLTVGGTSSPAGLSYNTTTGAWSLAVPAGVLPATLATYNIDVSATAGGLTRSDISSGELQIVVAPTITSIPEGPVINMVEAASVGGTPVNVGITGTGAVAGQVITVNWGTQTFTQVLTATDITNGTVAIVVPTATLQAQTAANTSGSVPVSVSLGNGVTSAVTTETVNFVTPTAPTINATAWTSTGAGNTSSLTGIPEALNDRQYTAFATYSGGIPAVDNQLYYSEAIANSGTIMRVQLPTTGVVGATNPALAGDTLTVTWGTQTLTGYTLLAADITAKYVDVVVSFSTISTQPYGTVPVAAVVTSAASGNSSPAASLNVTWAYDLPMDNLTSLSEGFVINGRSASSQSGYQYQTQGVVNVGDVNGDGYDDFSLLENTGGAKYVVYGRPGMTAVELSSLAAAGNTNGFIISGGSYFNTTGGDYNGDGLNDVIVHTGTSTYVVLGSTASPGAINVTSMAASQGFKITSPTYAVAAPTFIGDVNGDGLDDIILDFAVNATAWGNFVLYGSTNTSSLTIPTGQTGTFSNGFFINTGSTNLVSGANTFAKSGDFNGDGYSDFVLNNYVADATSDTASYVYFGGSNLTGITASALSVAGSGRGFAIKGMSGKHLSFYSTTTGDINGDGLDDMIFNDGGTNAYVLFGKTSDVPVNVSSLAAGSGGFVINGTVQDVDVVGDFNGDGLVDMVVSQTTGQVNGVNVGASFLLYGRTTTSAITLSNVAPSEGFRIDGPTGVGTGFGQSIAGGGDINGDGFADLIITAQADDPTGRTDAGITRVIYGGPAALNYMTFQAANGDAIGTTGADSLAGTSGANQLVAGDGNDTLTGAGGADVLYGGRGDDTLVIDASNIAALATNSGNTTQAIARVDGGNGIDTLQLMGSLDLGTIRPAAIQSIERINLFSAGTSLTMGLLDVLGLSEKNNPFNTATGWTATTATNWDTVNNGAQVVVDGTAANDLYLSGAWQSIGLVEHTEGGVTKTYKVLSDLTNAAAQVLVDSNVKLHMAPTVVSTANELAGSLNLTEANSSGGTPVQINLLDTDAADGMTLTLNWGGQQITVTLTQDDIDAGFVDITVPTAQLTAETPIGTAENVAASVTLTSSTGTTVAQSAAQPIAVDFVTLTTPTINSVTWAATGAGNTSSLLGIQEAYYDKQLSAFTATTTGFVIDNKLYYSEAVASANSGTFIRVQLPTIGAVPPAVNDTLTVTWGSVTLPAITLTATHVNTNKYVDIAVPFSTIDSLAFGNVPVTATITSAVSGNTSLPATVNVDWSYDLPVAQLTSLSAGFAINGVSTADGTGNRSEGVVNLGDINGDGYDDLSINQITTGGDVSTYQYIVYGRSDLATVELSGLSTVGNTNGFVINGSSDNTTRGGDFNGDGYSDFIIRQNGTTSYVVYGGSASPGLLNITALAASAGFKITLASTSSSTGTVVGDVNGDGYDDILFNMPSGENFLLYGAATTANLTLPTVTTGTYTNGFFLGKFGSDTSGGALPTASGDINGDGYSDFVLNSYGTTANGYVVFGGSNLSSISLGGLAAASRGFAISNLSTAGAWSYLANNMGDVNGDGMADFVINGGTAPNNSAFVVFGKTDYSTVTLSTLGTTSAGFSISAGANAAITDVDMIGDFNGDGLADMVLASMGATIDGAVSGAAYVVYGRTGASPLSMTDLSASEGFRIDGLSGIRFSSAVSGAGDVNGDGFDDVVISAPLDSPTSGRAQAGITRVIYGGVDKLESMTFQIANGDVIGTSGVDTLTGTSGNNQLVAGDGNDTLIGNGGADVLYGGRGEDTIVIDASNIAALGTNTGNDTQAIARVDGGNGIDTLELTASLDLGNIRPAAIQSIERFNLTGAGTSLTLGLMDVMALSEKNNPFNTATGWTATATGGATNWDAVNNGAQVVVDGTAVNDLYLNGAWQSLGWVTNNGKTYKVLSDLTKAEAQVLVDSNVKVHMAPTVITTANELAGSLNLTEANSTGGTDVRINLVDTDAADGMTIRLNWGGQTVSVTLTAADITNGYATLPLTTTQLTAETPAGTSENVAASVTLLSGTTPVAQSVAQAVAVNFVVPTTPIIDSTLWSAANTTSTLTGIPEASYAMDTTVMPAAAGFLDNTLYYSEATNSAGTGGTIMRVQLPTTGLVPTVAGDTLTVRWGDQVINVGAMSAGDITNKYKDVTISQATLETQVFGNVVVSADITSAASGNTSLTSPLTVKWAYDLPLAQLHSLSQGFQIEGNISAGKLGVSNENQGAQNVGDVNGDGFDDLEMTDISGNRYVVYGGNRLGALNVADLTAVGNTNGFMIASTNSLQPTRGGDINGDGLSDILIGNGTNSYIIFGKTTSIGKVTLAALGTNGFAFTSASSINEPSVVGDVNGDGYEDMLFNNSSNFTNYLVFGGTNFTPGGSVALPTGTSGTLATGTGAGTSYVQITNGGSFNSGGVLSTLHGDFNGDGYSDFALAQTPTTGIGTGPVYVYYGSASVTPWNSSSLTLAGNGRGFQITGLTGQNSIKFETTNMGDINGDGMDDIAFNDGTTRAFVLFGKTNSTSVNTTDLSAGNGGFIINAGTINANSVLTDVDVVGDFNGDGLADMVVSNTGMYTSGVVGGGAYLIYGRTATTALTLDSLEVSQGFRISGYSSTKDMLLGRTATAAGDFNGDGFADLAITTYQGEATGMTTPYVSGAGITRIVYGGVDKLETMTFQTANGDAIGTTGADTLLGTSGNNQIVAGDGADTLTGAGGADVLYGGRGDDLIIINADNVAKLGTNTGNDTQAIARVDGGAGIDTLRLDGGGIMLDLSLVSSPALQNIEKIDLTGSGNNTLKLSLQDMLQSFDNSNVFNSSNTTSGLTAKVTKNQLMVDGDAGDKLVLSDLASWTAAGTNVVANGHTYVAYNHNTSAQQLLIDLNVAVSAS